MSSDVSTGQIETREQEAFMRRLILQTGISIDGYVAALDRSHPWSDGSEDEAVKRWILDSVWAAGAHLMGRVTYEEMAAFWPTSTSEYARPMNEIPKVVFSDSLESADWAETTIASGDLTEEVTRLKQERSDGYLLAQGGARFARSLVEIGLIDEYRLVVHPVVLGAGEQLFTAPLTIEPISTTAFSGGAVAHVFAA
jgi:dihydrofolate reductase